MGMVIEALHRGLAQKPGQVASNLPQVLASFQVLRIKTEAQHFPALQKHSKALLCCPTNNFCPSNGLT